MAHYLRIVIPTKNEEKYLPKLLKSIREQTFKDIEIVVADADSDDKTKEIARNYGCKVVKGGLPDVGCNNGLKGCSTNLICFIESDIILPDNNFLSRAISELERKKLDIAGTIQTAILTKNKFHNILNNTFYNIANYAMILFQKSKKPLMQMMMIMKTKVVKDVGGFPPYEFGADSGLAKIAVAKGYKFGILNESGKILASPRRLSKMGYTTSMLKFSYLNLARFVGYEFQRGKTKFKYF